MNLVNCWWIIFLTKLREIWTNLLTVDMEIRGAFFLWFTCACATVTAFFPGTFAIHCLEYYFTRSKYYLYYYYTIILSFLFLTCLFEKIEYLMYNQISMSFCVGSLFFIIMLRKQNTTMSYEPFHTKVISNTPYFTISLGNIYDPISCLIYCSIDMMNLTKYKLIHKLLDVSNKKN